MSDEQREKIRASHLKLKRTLSEEGRKKVSESKKGVPRSEETKEKIRAALKGRKRPQEVVDKIQATKRAKPWKPTEENLKNMREAKKRNNDG